MSAFADHNYTIKWTSAYVAWMLDDVPIRITRRHKKTPFPTQHLNMQVLSCTAHELRHTYLRILSRPSTITITTYLSFDATPHQFS